MELTKYLLLLILFTCSCQTQTSSSSFQQIKDEKVKTTLTKAIKAMGGLSEWKRLKGLSFDKTYRLLDSTGQVEKAAAQHHHYKYTPEQAITITWEDDSLAHAIIAENGAIFKTVADKIDTTANIRSLRNIIFSSTFVIGIPYNLLDEGVVLNYEGQDVLENGEKVEVIRALYNPSENDNHTTPDIWWHYFDAENYRQLGYMVKHLDHYSYVRNEAFVTVEGFVFPEKRKSWRVDEHRNILYLRADYKYNDWSILK